MDHNIRLLRKITENKVFELYDEGYFINENKQYSTRTFIYKNLDKINVIEIIRDYCLRTKHVQNEIINNIFSETKITDENFYTIIWKIKNTLYYFSDPQIYSQEFIKMNRILDIRNPDCTLMIKDFAKALLKVLRKEYTDFIYEKLIRIPNMNKDVISTIIKTII